MPGALIIGNSDGIGLELSRLLLDAGWHVVGISRSDCCISNDRYTHQRGNVRDQDYVSLVSTVWSQLPERQVCVYCAGIAEPFEPETMSSEVDVFRVNLVGLVATAEAVIPQMVRTGAGHFVGLSSQADKVVGLSAPSYAASKAGISSYLHGLALALRKRGVHVTNVRFGFVDTKLSKSKLRPFMISKQKAAALVVRCLKRRPIRYAYPRRMALLLSLLRWGPRLRIWAS